MTFRSKMYTGLFSLFLNDCTNKNIEPITPTYPFKIQGYSVFVDDKPGDYYVIHINQKKYCYFWKQTEDENHDLFINDLGCDSYSDRVLVLSGNSILVASDVKHLDDQVVGMLNSVLRNHTKIIVNNTELDL